jgi:hypothetical protein
VTPAELCEHDFITWTEQQARLLRDTPLPPRMENPP